MSELNNELKKSKKKSKKNKEFIKVKKEIKEIEEETSIADVSGISAVSVNKSIKTEDTESNQESAPKSKKPKLNRGVVLIRGIPHGFYEPQLEQFFSQFGHVTRSRVARSKRTGKSKGFAYVEFRVPEVGKIAAETMDNYIMFKKRLRTVYIPPSERKYNLFNTSVKFLEVNGKVKLTSDVIDRREKIIVSYNKQITEEQQKKKIDHFESLIKKLKAKYEVIDGIKVDPVIYRDLILN